MRTAFSLAALVALVFALISVDQANAKFSQGNVDLTRDWTLQVRPLSRARRPSPCDGGGAGPPSTSIQPSHRDER